ncbi:MAG: cell wall metabolism sensor histidine kinase WalK [Thermoguttaceae bacterium]|nr:cell wall metabolism sensor histidine kinase WalK [Thermoguttaceae bacterium]
MRTRRLFWKLVPSYLLITLAALMAAGLYASSAVEETYRQQTVRDLTARAALARDELAPLLAAGRHEQVHSAAVRLGRASGTRITVVAPDGEVIGDSLEIPSTMDNHADRAEIRAALAGRAEHSERFSDTLQTHQTYVALPVAREGRVIGAVRVSIATSDVHEMIRSLHARLAWAGLIVALLAAGISLFVVRRIARPLEEIQRGAERFAGGDLQHKLPIPHTAEVAALAESMNRMALQLDDRINAAIRERNAREAVLSSMVEGVLAVDVDERVISINRAGAEVLGLEMGRVEGRTLQEVVRNPDLQRLVAQVLSSRNEVASEIEILHRGGGLRTLDAQGTVLRDAQGQAAGALVVLHDVTRLKRLENVRRDFVANVSHELKTPVTSIKGFVETLLDGAMHNSADAERFLRIIAAQADRLGAIIEDLLMLSRVEQGVDKAGIELHPGDIAPILERAAGICQHKAAERQITLDVRCEPDLAATVSTPLVEQAVVNLIDNAVKYSPAGATVSVAAERVADEIAIRVVDRGCGIPREHLGRVFERFYRVDKARSRELGGTGLGLAIVKHIAQAHGGRATAQSIVGQGSTFTIWLPARQAARSGS